MSRLLNQLLEPVRDVLLLAFSTLMSPYMIRYFLFSSSKVIPE